jgi:BirA family transcriptional regulator, biotin operon repressor / biotin---[acetyl-CoA-carboxylase] ligase
LPNKPFLDVIGSRLFLFESLDSTNNYAMGAIHDGKAAHGTVYQALEQTAGKGQRGKTWISGRDMNMALSVTLNPSALSSTNQFLLSAAVAVAVRDWLSIHTTDCMIKWPNDIYISDKKIAGILIENIFRGTRWTDAVAGIGANINQKGFPESLPNAISLHQATGQTYDLILLGKELCQQLEEKWQLLQQQPETIVQAYNQHLYKKEHPVRFKEDNRVYTATVKQVTTAGELLVANGTDTFFVPNGVTWLI